MKIIYLTVRRTAEILSLTIVLGLFYAPVCSADVLGDSQWRVEAGDNVYSIARKVFPNDGAKQSQFRKELVRNNPDIFRGNANLMRVGTVLELPGFSIAAPAAPSKPEANKQKQASVQILKKPKATAVADPEEVIGKVVVSAGSMEADNRGSQRKMVRNSKILKGDTLLTASDSYTQIRMTDGALISLRPNTKLVINEYSFNGSEDGSEKSFMELVSGGFRTVTGLIGHKNKNNYQVKTPVATIGIRGTHYGLMVCSDGACADEDADLKDGLYGGVVDGSIIVQNDAGELIFGNDQYFHVESANTLPVEELEPPPVFHGKNEQRLTKARRNLNETLRYSDADLAGKIDANGELNDTSDRAQTFLATTGGLGNVFQPYVDPIRNEVPVLSDQNDNPLINPPANTAPNGSGVLIGFTGNDITTGDKEGVTASIAIGSNSTNEIAFATKLDADGVVIKNIPVAGQSLSGSDLHTLVLPSGTAGVTDIGGSTFGVNWGRWSNPFVLTENGAILPTYGNLHYIYSDKLTSATQLTALGGLLTTETYTMAGGTTPTNPLGQQASLIEISATTDFVARTLTNYQVNAQDGGASFSMKNAAPVSFNNMNNFNLVDAGCTVACQGRASAAFVGSQAEGMMTTYSMSELSGDKGATGAALLVRGNVTVPAQ